MTTITLVKKDGSALTVDSIKAAADHIDWHPSDKVTIYGSRADYEAVRSEVIRRGEVSDHGAIDSYRWKKQECVSSNDREELNDMIDTAYERIKQRKNQLSYGGEAYKL